MGRTEALKVDDKTVEHMGVLKKLDTIEHAELLKIVVNQKRAELDDLNHKVLLAKNNLRAIENGCRKTQADFNQKLAVEKQEIERLKNKKINEFAQQEDRMQQGIRRMNERDMRLQEKEGTQAKLDAEREAVYRERIEIEKIKNNSQEELKRTLALKGEATSKLNQASIKEAETNKKLSSAKQLVSQAEYKFGQAVEKEKKVAGDLENLVKIRKEITPKITELEILAKKNERLLVEAKKKEDIANAKAEENRQIMSEIEKKHSALKTKELEVTSREEAILRQEIIIKSLKK